MRFCIPVAIVSLRYRSPLPGSLRDAGWSTITTVGQSETGERSRIAAAQIETLSPRQKQVLGGMVSGLLNKQIAARLGISEKTVKLHRAHLALVLLGDKRESKAFGQPGLACSWWTLNYG